MVKKNFIRTNLLAFGGLLDYIQYNQIAPSYTIKGGYKLEED
jgi:hypothetical protein